jgi:hypothetical protein
MAVTASGSFHAAESSLTKSSLFKVYATPDAFHFARIGDKNNAANDNTAVIMFGLMGLLIKKLVMEPAARRQRELEEHYDLMEPGGPEFLGQEQRNFTVRTADIRAARLKKASLLSKGSTMLGSLELELNDGSRRHFTVISRLAPLQVENVIRSVLPGVEGSLS